MNKTFSSKSNAKRAAQTELGASAVEAEDYKVTQDVEGRWRWAALTGATGGRSAATNTTAAATPAVPETATDGATKAATREGSKQARLIGMLKTTDGATVAEIAAAFGWQKHTVRGAIAGALKKRLGLAVASAKVEGRGRVYRIAG